MKKTFLALLIASLMLSGCSILASGLSNMDPTALATAANTAMTALTISDEQIAQLSAQSVAYMDSVNKIDKGAYDARLRKLMSKVKTVDGVPINLKVYRTNEVNAFACGDGSIRVYSGLMDVMDDSELMAVIGHEIGHVLHKDTKNAMKKTALVSGVGEAAIALAEEAQKEQGYDVVGFISRDPKMNGCMIGNRLVYYIAKGEDLSALMWRLGGIDCILFTKEEGVTDRSETVLEGKDAPKVQDGMNMVGHMIKRTFDVVLSSVLLIIFSPVILLCAIAIKMEDKGPVIFSQERIGRDGKPFNIYKFRSMRVDAEVNGPALYSENDDRLTKVGKFLREHHLDELPQLWNVLRGDMSFIGYRPERKCYIDRIVERNPRYMYLYQIRPGVTSFATLYNGYTDTLDKMLTRLDLDLYYLRNHSVWFDMKVLGLTFLSIITGKKF